MPLPTLINYGLYLFVALLAVIGLSLGFSRGLSRQTMRFIFVAISFGVSFAAFSALYPALYSIVEGKTLADIAETYGIGLSDELAKYAVCIRGETAVYIASVPLAILVFPIGFLLMFATVISILTVPYVVICGALGFGSKYNTTVKRILGAIVGTVQGVLIALLILMPIDGMIDVATEAITVAEEEHPDSQNSSTVANIYHQNFDTVVENPVLKFTDASFGFIYDKFSMITVEGENVSVREIVDDMFELFVLYGDLGADFDFTVLTEDNKRVIDEMLECFGDDHLMTAIVSGAVSSIGKASNNGAFTFDVGEPMQSLYMSLLDVCSTSDSTTVEADLKTLSRVYYLFSDEGMLTATTVSNMFSAFLITDADGNSAFKRMVTILNENERFISTANVCTEVAMALLLQNSGTNKDTMETIMNVKDGINKAVAINKDSYDTDEEYKEAVNSRITETLRENDISLSEEKINELTDYVIENYGNDPEKTEITDEEFLDFMSKYYDTYAKKSDGAGIPDGTEDTEDVGGTDGTEDAGGVEDIEGIEP